MIFNDVLEKEMKVIGRWVAFWVWLSAQTHCFVNGKSNAEVKACITTCASLSQPMAKTPIPLLVFSVDNFGSQIFLFEKVELTRIYKMQFN